MKTAITPMLYVRRGAQAIDFYKAALGAVELYRVENDKGEVVAQMSVDGAEFWVADESPEHHSFSPESLTGVSARMLLIVDDPGAAFDKAVGAGAIAKSPVSKSHGWLIGRVEDPFGHQWEIGKPGVR